ncbi:heterokaryon incompatibility protein-domain-containing protein [Lophiotrema nucula]|uniref:Heterokaryon incompatibility protein-domain-containing protein n=1 Tax=Lophiotrema nucula TaxID=690887 RepID=A0A6A5ZSI6_9PLEO|nr:heterokaryon incompatibility protein-domain-containing protein [Lophiotrema nucula]
MANIDTFKAEIPWDSLPRTFQDALTLVHRLGIQYLWIDSLCILQNNEADWLHEGSKMAEIYKNSFLTIAATRATDSTAGLFAMSPGHLSRSYYYDSQEFRVRKLLPHDLGNRDGLSPLLNRGWVLQERLLSPCIVHFSAHELWWECFEATDCECKGPGKSAFTNLKKADLSYDEWATSSVHCNPHRNEHLDLPDNYSLPVSSSSFAGSTLRAPKRWRQLVEEYSSKILSYDKDILPAIQGLAKEMHNIMRCEYLAGLWRDDIIVELLWVKRGDPDRANLSVPSWSWASAGGPIRYIHDVSSGEWDSRASLQDYRIDRLGEDGFGQVSRGELEIEGRCVTASFSQKVLAVSQMDHSSELWL